MTDLTDVVNSLFGGTQQRRPVARGVERISDGVFHLDYHDPDHVFLVTVHQVPRIQLPIERPVVVAEVSGVPVALTQVGVANHVEVVLDAEHGPARDSFLADFTARFNRWEAEVHHGRPPPPWPGEQLTAIALVVSDDLGTAYRRVSAEAGGMETPFRCRMAFLPSPPVSANHLMLDITRSAGTPVQVRVPLPDRASRTRPPYPGSSP